MNAPERPEPAAAADGPTADERDAPPGHDGEPRLGEILRRTRGLTPEQVQRALDYQAEHGIRFGEAVVKLGLAAPDDVMRAMSRQFHFPYAAGDGAELAPELVLARRPFDADVEIFRDLRSQLLMGGFGAPDDRTALAVVSADRGDGKTFLAANLAVAFAQLPGRTLVVDADLRSPRLHEVFRCPRGSGLAEAIGARAKVRVLNPVPQMPNLYVMPAGTTPPNPSELFLEATFSRVLAQLTAKFDFVIVDTPAAAHGSDARVVASRCGAALAVARRNRTHLRELHLFLEQVRKSRVNLSGLLMNEF